MGDSVCIAGRSAKRRAHFHRTITEHFYVLRGTVSLHNGSKWMAAYPGDYLYVPAGGLHGFRGGDYAQMLLSFAPGGPREDYFETTARGDLDNMSDDERQAFMDRHDILDLKLVSRDAMGRRRSGS